MMYRTHLDCLKVGSAAEAFVQYKMLRWGEQALMVNSVEHYDLVVLKEIPIRIQVKARSTVERHCNSYGFNTASGCGKSHYPLNSLDLFCFVALDIEQMTFIYLPHIGVIENTTQPVF